MAGTSFVLDKKNFISLFSPFISFFSAWKIFVLNYYYFICVLDLFNSFFGGGAVGRRSLDCGRSSRRGRDARMPFQSDADGQTSHLLLDPGQHERKGQRRHWRVAI